MLKRPIILVSIGSILGILMGIYTQGIFPFLFIIIIVVITKYNYNYKHQDKYLINGGKGEVF